MAFYKNHVYPYLVSVLGNPKATEDIPDDAGGGPT
jgi:hypothetical protein